MFAPNADSNIIDGRLLKAETLILDALRSGAVADPRLLEATALDLMSLGDDKPRQLKSMLDAVRFFYVNGQFNILKQQFYLELLIFFIYSWFDEIGTIF